MSSLPRSQRLKRRRLIKRLFDRNASTVLRHGCVRLHYRLVPRTCTGSDSPIQVGFAPSRQQTKVRRNRLRRVMRETWRTHQNLMDLGMIDTSSTLTVMVLCKPPAEENSVRNNLIDAMRRLSDTLADTQPGGS